jgi:chromosomal replication initiation ATPase DnaA
MGMRILGDSGFVDTVLSEAKEAYEHKYELKRRGYDVERIAKRVAEICGVGAEEVFSKGRQQKKVKARSLLCYWAVRAAEISLRTLSKRLRMSAPGVGYAVERGEAIVQESHYELIQ